MAQLQYADQEALRHVDHIDEAARSKSPADGNLDQKPEEAGKAPPEVRYESRFDQSGEDESSGILKEESMAKELQEQPAAAGDIVDVRSLTDDYVDLSEGKPNQLNVNDSISEGSPNQINVDNSTSERNPNQRNVDGYNSKAASHGETAQMTSQIKSPFDDHKQDQSSQISFAEEEKTTGQPVDDSKKEQGSKPSCDDEHGCERFEGDDGREKISVEGLNIYSGEPENVVYDAVSGQPEPESEMINANDSGDLHQQFKDQPAPGGGIIDVHSLKDDYMNLSESSNDVGDIQQERKPFSNDDGDVSDLQEGNTQSQTEEGADIALEFEDKASVADAKRDKQTGMRQVCNPDQPLGVDEDECLQEKLILKGDESKGAKQDEETTDIGGGLGEEQKDITQAGAESPYTEFDRTEVCNPDQPRGVDEDERLQEKSMQKGDESKGAKQDEETTDIGGGLGEEQKDIAQAGAESPYTEFDRTDDYVKIGYGGDGFLPKNNEEVDRKLREPVDQEMERRQTDEHPLDKSMELDAQGMSEGKASSEALYGIKEGNVHGIRGTSDNGKYDEGVNASASGGVASQRYVPYERPLTMPHPQPEDLAGYLNNKDNNTAATTGDDYNDNNNSTNNANIPDDGQHPEAADHKKGVFERIKEKLTPPYNEHSK